MFLPLLGKVPLVNLIGARDNNGYGTNFLMELFLIQSETKDFIEVYIEVLNSIAKISIYNARNSAEKHFQPA